MATVAFTDRLSVYHTGSGQESPEDWQETSAIDLAGRIEPLTNMQALAADQRGQYKAQATHKLRCEPSAEVVVNSLVRRHRDDACFLVLSIRLVGRRNVEGRPDHYACEVSVVDKPPALPDALTQARRDR